MQVVCPNPGCGAVYTVGPQHVGKQFPCRSCGTTVVVHASAVGVDPAPAVPAVPSGPPAGSADPAAAAAQAAGRVDPSRLVASARADLLTWVLGAGLIVLALFAVVLPHLDRAKVVRLRGKVQAAEAQQSKLNSDLERRRVLAAAGKGTAPSADEDKARKEAYETWQREGRPEAEADARDAEVAAQMWPYWYVYGGVLGMLLVTVAGLGYLAAGRTTARRVTGAVIVGFIAVSLIGLFFGYSPGIAIK